MQRRKSDVGLIKKLQHPGRRCPGDRAIHFPVLNSARTSPGREQIQDVYGQVLTNITPVLISPGKRGDVNLWNTPASKTTTHWLDSVAYSSWYAQLKSIKVRGVLQKMSNRNTWKLRFLIHRPTNSQSFMLSGSTTQWTSVFHRLSKAWPWYPSLSPQWLAQDISSERILSKRCLAPKTTSSYKTTKLSPKQFVQFLKITVGYPGRTSQIGPSRCTNLDPPSVRS